jgi:hypothetical protein
VLQHMKKLFPSRYWTISLAGLLLTLGFAGHRAQPVLSTQIEKLRASTLLFTDLEVSKDNSLRRDDTRLAAALHETKSNLNAENTQQEIARYDATPEGSVNSFSKNAPERDYSRLRAALGESEPGFADPNQEEVARYAATPELQPELDAVPQTKALLDEPEIPRTKAAVTPKARFPQADGIYLYGQSPKSGQMGQGYIIFEKRQGNVTGALYMPNSEFSCFNGTLEQSGELAMTVIGSPGDSSPTQVASTNTAPRLYDDEPISYAHSVALQDYYPLNSVSVSDREILLLCNQTASGSYTRLVK